MPQLPRKLRVAALPESLDWRNHNGYCWVTPAKDQGQNCGSCWAFASVAQFEAAVKILSARPNLPTDLSEQELVSCDTNSMGCLGGYFAMEYMSQVGLVDEDCFRYDESQDASTTPPCSLICPDAPARRNYRLNTAAYNTNFSLDDVKAVVSVCPTYFVIWIYSSFLSLDSLGRDTVWLPDTSDEGDTILLWGGLPAAHAMLCIGWNDREGCLIFKNSWGTAFAESGFCKISYACLDTAFPKCVWADPWIYPVESLGAKTAFVWKTTYGSVIKAETTFSPVDPGSQRQISTPLFFEKDKKWYIVEGWEYEKFYIDDTVSASGDGNAFSTTLDAPMTVEWTCAETTAAATECLKNENIIIYPNPFYPAQGELTISFMLCKDGIVNVKVFDVGYNLVRTIVEGEKQEAGIKLVTWDGTNQNGDRVVPGVYYIVVENLGGEFGVGKVAVCR